MMDGAEDAVDQVELHSFVAQQRHRVLSGISGEGIPRSALVGIAVTSGLEIVFDTVKCWRKYPNLIARTRCSFVVGGLESNRAI
jgi:hypothetical protein